jgi:hypothetical protein
MEEKKVAPYCKYSKTRDMERLECVFVWQRSGAVSVRDRTKGRSDHRRIRWQWLPHWATSSARDISQRFPIRGVSLGQSEGVRGRSDLKFGIIELLNIINPITASGSIMQIKHKVFDRIRDLPARAVRVAATAHFTTKTRPHTSSIRHSNSRPLTSTTRRGVKRGVISE